jgi:hypothetical protein
MAASKSSYETGVRRLIRQVRGAARSTAASRDLGDSDRTMMERLDGDLAAFSKPMIMLLKSLDGKDAREFALQCLWSLLGAAFYIGTKGKTLPMEATPSGRIVTSRQAAVAREGLTRKTIAKNEQLKAAILIEAGKARLVGTRKFAESLVNGVVERTGGSADGKSASTIQRLICEILKERRRDRSQP